MTHATARESGPTYLRPHDSGMTDEFPAAHPIGTFAGRILQPGESLFHAGESAEHLYRVISGVLKSCRIHPDGTDQVLAFHQPGDVVGYDALLRSERDCSVVALDTANVATLASSLFTELEQSGELGRVIAAMYHDLQRAEHQLHHERLETTARVADFILGHAHEQAARGFSKWEMVLPMSRRDLALYLRLAPETLCRTFSALRKAGCIEVERNFVRLLDPERLRTVAAGAAP